MRFIKYLHDNIIAASKNEKMPYINIIIRHLVVVKLYEKEFDSVGFNARR